MLSITNTDLLLNCGVALHRSGDARASRVIDRLRAMRPLPTSAIARWHAATGDLTRAFDLFAELTKASNLPPNIAFDPMFEPLRADPRYAGLRSATVANP
jgi:hypothetical protein